MNKLHLLGLVNRAPNLPGLSRQQSQLVALLGWEQASELVELIGGLAYHIPADPEHLPTDLDIDTRRKLCAVYGRTRLTLARPNKFRQLARDAEIRRLSSQGHTLNDLALQFDLSSRAISTILAKPDPAKPQASAPQALPIPLTL